MIEHAKESWLRWLSHVLLAIGAAVAGGLLAHYVVLWLPWFMGTLLGATLSLVFFAHREGGDVERHRIEWARLHAAGLPMEADKYRRLWTLDGWMGFLGPALVWVLVTALCLHMVA